MDYQRGSIANHSPDPQVYDVTYLDDRTGKIPYRAALNVFSQYKPEIEALARAGDKFAIRKFVEEKAAPMTRGKRVSWGYYLMPD